MSLFAQLVGFCVLLVLAVFAVAFILRVGLMIVANIGDAAGRHTDE